MPTIQLDFDFLDPTGFAVLPIGSGTVAIDEKAGLLVFSIEDSSFPNWAGTVQKRHYQLEGDELSYKVPPRPDGSTPVSIWRRLP